MESESLVFLPLAAPRLPAVLVLCGGPQLLIAIAALPWKAYLLALFISVSSMEQSDGSSGLLRPCRHHGRLPKGPERDLKTLHSRGRSTHSLERRSHSTSSATSSTMRPSLRSLYDHGVTREQPTGAYMRHGATAKRRLYLLLGAAVVFLVVLALCILVYNLLLSAFDSPLVRCTSESCVAHSRRLQATLNTSVDPCHDFYSFVCDGWQSSFPHLSVLDKINEDVFRSNIKEVSDDLWRAIRSSRLLYKCTTPERGEVAENLSSLKEFKEFLSLYWPEKDPGTDIDNPLRVMVYMAVTYDINFLFSLEIAYSNVSGDIIILRTGHPGVVWRDRMERPLSQIEYARVVREHLSALNVTSVKITSAQLQELEKAFLVAIQPTANRQQSFFILGDLDSKTPSIEKGIWLYSMRSNYNPLGFSVTGNTWVVFDDPKFLDSIDGLFDTYNNLDLLVGISWMFIQSHLWAALGKPELMFRDNIEEKKQRACLEFVNSRLGLLSSAHFVTTRFPTPETRQELANFFASVKTSFKSLAKNSSWIDSQSKETMERKIDAMKISVLPAELFFLPLQRDLLYASFTNVESLGFVENWLVNSSLQLQNLQRHKHFKDIYSKRRSFRHAPYSYTYLLNEVEGPIAAIEPPLLYQNGPSAINYASAGSLIAREIAKSIDPQGTLIDDRGEYVIWWGKAYSAEYGHRISCDLGDSGQPRMNLFPTIPALEASFFAYKAAVAEEAAIKGYYYTPLKLAGLEGYSEDQIFFMTYCYVLCSRKGTSSAVHHCNAPLRNNFHFSEAFKCPPGSPMNSTEKCSFFV